MISTRSLHSHVGANIRHARKKAGLTQQQLADRIGRHRVNVCNYERGSQRLSLELLYEIAVALNVSIRYLVPMVWQVKLADANLPVSTSEEAR